MHMITRKKIIAALLIPIMLIAFSTPSFAATSTSFDVKGFFKTVLNVVDNVGGESLTIVKNFVSDFMGINDVNDAIELSGDLINTGISSVTELVGIFSTASYTPEGILPLLGKLLSFTINTGITFADKIFVADLSNPAGFMPFIGDLLDFSINAGKTLVGAVIDGINGEQSTNTISNLFNGSTFDLSGIFDMLVQSNGQLPSTDVSGILENFNTSNVIGLLGNIMGGTPEDLLNSGTDIIEGLFNSLTTTDTNKPQIPVDFTDIADNEKEETPTTDKPAINNDPDANNTNLGDYYYNNAKYVLAVDPQTLVEVLRKLENDETLHDETKYNNKDLADSHIEMLLDKVSNVTAKKGELTTLKDCIDKDQPARVNIDTNTYLTCIGYTNNGAKLSDFLFINPIDGRLKTLPDSISLPNSWNTISIFN